MKTLFEKSRNTIVTYNLESSGKIGKICFNLKRSNITEIILVYKDDINPIGYGLDHNALIYKESHLYALTIKDSVLVIREKGEDGKLLYVARLEDDDIKDIKALCTALMIISSSSAKDKFDSMF